MKQEKVSTFEVAAPPKGKTRYDWEALADQRRAKPMEWVRVFEHDRASLANMIRQGRVPALHEDLGFETVTTNNTRGKPRMCTLYVRYNPDLVVDDIRETILTSRKKG